VLKGDVELVRTLNASLLLATLRRRGRASRAELAAATGLTSATVSHIVADLLAAGWLREVGEGRSAGGRRPVLLELNPDSRFVVAVDLAVRQVRVAAFDLRGSVLARRDEALPCVGRDAVDAIGSMVERVLADAGIAAAAVRGVGVSVPGWLDPATGDILALVNLPGWEGVPLKALLEERLHLPVRVDNDANAAALGELWFGAGAGSPNLAYVLVDEGVGCGIIVDRQIYRGLALAVGELGHVTVEPDGLPCRCGNTGCLEALVSRGALAAQWRTAGREDGYAGLVAAYRDADPAARAFVSQAAARLGIGLAGLINLFSPGLVALGGGVIDDLPELAAEATAIAYRRSLPVLSQRVRVIRSALACPGPLAGAAALIWDELFHPVRLGAGGGGGRLGWA
jgi:predicted NBD/HSP70 family sugar kinase